MAIFNYKKTQTPSKGNVLISEPFITDVNFTRTLVLLCKHNEEGSFGFVLNKPSNLQTNDILSDMPTFNMPIYLGGPVQQDNLFFLHQEPCIAGAVLIKEGIYWGADFEELKYLLRTNVIASQNIKLFLGYSGWDPHQLEEEIHEKTWIVNDQIDSHLVFSVDARLMWKKTLRAMGDEFALYADSPLNPRLN